MNGSRETFKHAAVYSMAAMFSKLISFVMLPFYSHILRGIGYAVIGMLDVGLALLMSLLAYGVQGSIIRFYHDEKAPERKRLVVGTGVILVFFASLLAITPFMIFSRPVSSFLLDDPALNHLLILALISFVLDLVGSGASAWLLIRRRSTLFALINLGRLIIGLSLNIWLILIRGMGLDGYFISSLAASVFSAGLFFAVAVHDCGLTFDKAIAWKIQRYVLPLVPGNLISFVSRQIERILVKFQVDLESVGVLGMGYKFPELIAQLISTPFMQSWDTKRFEIADQENGAAVIGRTFTHFLFLAVMAGLSMAVVIKPVLAVMTPPEFHVAYRIAWAEILTVIMQGCYYHVIFGLFYAKHTGVISQIRIWTSLAKIALSYLFISLWGLYGAAYSGAVIASITMVLAYRYGQSRYRVLMEWGKILTIVGTALAFFGILVSWDPASTRVYGWLQGQVLPRVASLLQGTFLGTWKNGKAITLLLEQSGHIAEILLKTPLSLLFGLLLPWIHLETRLKIMAKIRGLLALPQHGR